MIKFKNIETIYNFKSALRKRSKRDLNLTDKTVKVLYLCYLFFNESKSISLKNLIVQAAKDGNGEFNTRNIRAQLNQLESAGFLTSRKELRRGFSAKIYTINSSLVGLLLDIERGIEKRNKLGVEM
ncbi:MAG: hypothetical protein Q8K64_08245 [Sediminibacterium sp.]|nr:hypothetical protein [Sediminibacterium sp.]